MQTEKKYDNYEIHPVVALDKDNNPTRDEAKIVAYDQCAEDDPDLFMWSVYGHLPTGGIECIADCASKEAAELIQAGLMERLARPALLDAALQARIALLPHRPAANLQETVRNATEVERAIRTIDRAVSGATVTESHLLIPINKATVRKLLPDVDEDGLNDVLQSFRDRLEDDLLPEFLPEFVQESYGSGLRN